MWLRILSWRMALKDFKDFKDFRDFRVFKIFGGFREFKGLKALAFGTVRGRGIGGVGAGRQGRGLRRGQWMRDCGVMTMSTGMSWGSVSISSSTSWNEYPTPTFRAVVLANSLS